LNKGSCRYRGGLGFTARILLFIAPAAACAGGAITLETTLRTTVAETTVRTTLAVRNTGTDAAHDVTPRLRFANVERTGPLVRDLPPGRAHEWTVEFPRPPAAGRYPLLLTVAYNDPGYRSFSAPSAALVDVGGAFPARVHGSVPPLAVDSDGTLTIVLVDDDTVPHTARVGVLLPDELGGPRPIGSVELMPGKTSTLALPLQNHGGLAGSRYPVYAVVQLTDGEHETAALVSGQVTIVTALAVNWGSYLPQVAAALALLWAVAALTLALRRRRPPRAAPAPRRTR
jgi:hypothetical protein